MDDAIFPVCSPRLLEGSPPLRSPDDLKRHTLLHDDMARSVEAANDWRAWLQAAGVAGVDPTRGPAYSHSSLVLQAAIDGQGVALGRTSLATDDMAAGRLVCPFGPVVKAPLAYYIVSLPAAAEMLKVTLFRDWLLEEAALAEETRPVLPN